MKVLNLRFTFPDSVPPGLRLKTGKKKLSTPAVSQKLRPPLVAEPHATSLLVILTSVLGSNFNPQNTQCILAVNPAFGGIARLLLR